MKTLVAGLTALLLIFAATGTAAAQERILDYRSDITVAADGSMTVSEHIRVLAAGQAIRHGIYRDFPTDYRDRQRNRYRVDFEVLGARFDGEPAPWRRERRANGVRVYVGDADRLVRHGEHDYVIRYRTTRQLGFFADHDELYWNVTGSGWDFPIDRVEAVVQLPQTVPGNDLRASGFTGAQGSTARDLATTLRPDGARYVTTAPLGAQQNLTVVLAFPKGIVSAPSDGQRLAWLLHDNRGLLLALIGLVLLWLFYLRAWSRYGRDPESGPLVARYQPPDGSSAAALRFVRRMGYDNTCLSAGVLDLAAHGLLDIEQDDKAVYTLIRAPHPPAVKLQRDNEALLGNLFQGGDRLRLKQENHQRLQAAQTAQRKALAYACEKRYFLTNTRKMWPGLLISALTLAGLMWGKPPEVWFMVVWLGLWTLGVLALFRAAVQTPSKTTWLLAIIFGIAQLAGMAVFGFLAGYLTVAALVLLLGTNFAFYHWMKAPTQLGARLLDKINGFRWYLGVAEKQELDSRYKPEARPDLFGRYLPYAVALDVDNAWAERFARALTPEQLRAAQPGWYHGSQVGSFTAAGFANFSSSLGSGLSGAIAASSTAPGSSSGSGGSSGGGGGGGGGGGW